MNGGRHPCKAPASGNAPKWRVIHRAAGSSDGGLCKPATSSLVTATPNGVGSETTSRHQAYGNLQQLYVHTRFRSETTSRHQAYGNKMPIACPGGHISVSETTSRHQAYGNGYMSWGTNPSARARPKQRHAIRRMETYEASAPALLGRVRNNVTPSGVWKLCTRGRMLSVLVSSETTSRHQAYG